MSACTSSPADRFDVENEQIKSEFKKRSEQFVKANASKLTDKQLCTGMDSIAEEYVINRNKKLAVKYINTEKGLKRLNFLKDQFSKKELENLLNRVSSELKTNSDYQAIKSYLK